MYRRKTLNCCRRDGKDRARAWRRVADLCTGSGVVAIAAASREPRRSPRSTSARAPSIARANAAAAGVDVQVHLGSWPAHGIRAVRPRREQSALRAACPAARACSCHRSAGRHGHGMPAPTAGWSSTLCARCDQLLAEGDPAGRAVRALRPRQSLRGWPARAGRRSRCLTMDPVRPRAVGARPVA